MAVAVVQNNSAAYEAANPQIHNFGSTATAGNLLLVQVTRNSETTEQTATGWTNLVTGGTAHGTARTDILYKVSDGTETSITVSGVANKRIISFTEISGQAGAWLDQSSVATGLSNSADATTITPSVNDCLIFSSCGVNNLATVTVDATLTSLWSDITSGGGAVSSGGGYLVQTTAAATGTLSHGLSASWDWAAYQLAIKPTDPTNVTATSDSIALTKQDATVTAQPQIAITATSASLALTPQNATVTALGSTDVVATSAAISLTSFDAFTSQSEAPTEWFNGQWWRRPWWGSNWWGQGFTAQVFADSAALSITPANATVKANIDTNVTATIKGFTFGVNNASVTTSTGLNVTADAASLLLAPQDAAVQANVDLDVTATADSLSLTPFNASVATYLDTIVTADSNSIVLTPFNAVVAGGGDTAVTAGSRAFNFTSYDTIVRVAELQGSGGIDEKEERIEASYQALKLAINKYYGIDSRY